MRIVIDLQGAQTTSRFRGIGRYTISFVKALIRNADNHELILVLNGNLDDSFINSSDGLSKFFGGLNIKYFCVNGPVEEMEQANAWRTRASEYLREYFIASLKPDVVLLTSLFEGYKEPAVTSVKAIYENLNTAVIHYDLIPYLHPEEYLLEDRMHQWYQRKIDCLRNADLLLAISGHSRNEAVEMLAIKDKQIINISTAADQFFEKIEVAEDHKREILKKFKIQKQFILYMGGFDHRKNLKNLIVAYSKLPDVLREKYQLVLAGKVNIFHEGRLLYYLRKYGLNDREFILTNQVSDQDLLYLYNLCELFVFPSLHEGFGLPVLEALSCGAPVIGSNATSIPEVIGCSEALFDPQSVESIYDKMQQVLTDQPLRDKLKKQGLKQAKEFSWDKTATIAIKAIEENFSEVVYDDNYDESAYRQFLDAIAKINVMKPTDNDLKHLAYCLDKNRQAIR